MNPRVLVPGVRITKAVRARLEAEALAEPLCQAVLASPFRHLPDEPPCGLRKLDEPTGIGGLALPLCPIHALLRPMRSRVRGEMKYEARMGLRRWLERHAGAERRPRVRRPDCPGCGCGGARGTVCLLRWPGGEGLCAPAGMVPGLDVCSGCATPAPGLGAEVWRSVPPPSSWLEALGLR